MGLGDDPADREPKACAALTASAGLERGTTAGDCLVWCGADDGLRGAAVLTYDGERS